MHELGILYHVLKTVDKIAKKNHILSIKHVTLEVGRESGCVPTFLEKLFPLAVDKFPLAKDAELYIQLAKGRKLLIKDIGY